VRITSICDNRREQAAKDRARKNGPEISKTIGRENTFATVVVVVIEHDNDNDSDSDWIRCSTYFRHVPKRRPSQRFRRAGTHSTCGLTDSGRSIEGGLA
jgi:hypothetical protein